MSDLAPFDFALPPDRIAQEPARPRDSARLLEVGASLADRHVRDLPGLLRAGDVLVANDTRVIPAQLTAVRARDGGEGARVGVTLDRPLADGCWHALVRNARRLRAGDVLRFVAPSGAAGAPEGDALCATVERRDEDGGASLRFDAEGPALEAALERVGALALPPYIARPGGVRAEDAADYQTVWARHAGAVAAPTAGLHFTPSLLAALSERGVLQVTGTLHVGAGTFLPVREADPRRHRMHPERAVLSAEAAEAVNAARARGGRVVAVGTTSLRLLESAAAEDGRLSAFSGETSLFVLPGHRFRVVDALLTNFHLPRSTLFMLVCALAGTERMRAAYAHAIASGYRFYSYGDASLLWRA